MRGEAGVLRRVWPATFVRLVEGPQCVQSPRHVDRKASTASAMVDQD